MPALHDFALLVSYTQKVATIVDTAITTEERKQCTHAILQIQQHARETYGTGGNPGQLVTAAVAIVLPNLPATTDKLVTDAVLKLRSHVDNVATTGYGILDVFRNGSLFHAVVCACIDDVLPDGELTWKEAFRVAATSRQDGAFEMRRIQLCFMLIAWAFEGGGLLKSFLLLDVTATCATPPVIRTGQHAGKLARKHAGVNMCADLITMFGKYVASDSVKACEILRDVAATREANTALQRIALEAIMWNLTALDVNRTEAPPVPWEEDHIRHSLKEAEVPGELIHSQLFAQVLAEAEVAFATEIATARADAARFAVRRGHVYVIRLRLRQVIAWVYIATVVIIAVLCSALNWPNRDNMVDRAKDGFDITTLFLVSVFGLIKLTSEDPNALKNLASGRSLVDDLADAAKYLRGSREIVQKLLAVESNPAGWAAAEGCSYGRSLYSGGLPIGPARLSTLKQCGFFFLEGICKRPYCWDTCAVVENVKLEVAQISKDAGSDCLLSFCTLPKYSLLA